VSEDDIVSDTLLALYQNLQRIHPPENLRPFLFRIVRNLCYTELRRQGRYQTIMVERTEHEEDLLASLPDGRATPEGELQRLLHQAELQQARDELPELQRQTLILYCEEDLPYAQIAEVMATDIGTVKSRLFYARKFLVKRLSPETLTALGIHE
jgi:RNA polymerase sigma-70 factor (ECF subfamily)